MLLQSELLSPAKCQALQFDYQISVRNYLSEHQISTLNCLIVQLTMLLPDLSRFYFAKPFICWIFCLPQSVMQTIKNTKALNLFRIQNSIIASPWPIHQSFDEQQQICNSFTENSQSRNSVTNETFHIYPFWSSEPTFPWPKIPGIEINAPNRDGR